MDNEVKRVFLHVSRLDLVGCLENLDHVLKGHVHLQVLLAERLKEKNR